MPGPMVVLPFFIWSLVGNLYAAINLAGHVDNNALVSWGLIIAPLLNAAGGVLEAVVAESTFNQWHHLAAVIVLLGGVSLQAWCLFQVPGLFV